MRTDKLFGKPGWVGWGMAYYAVDLSPPSERGSVPFMPWEPCQTPATVDYSIDLQPSSLQDSIFFLCLILIVDLEKGGTITVGQFKEGAEQGISLLIKTITQLSNVSGYHQPDLSTYRTVYESCSSNSVCDHTRN